MLGCVIGLLLALHIRDSTQHGYLAKPTQRSSLWRHGYPAPPNYNDNELYCGGIQALIDAEGKCGPCGDPYFGVRENEAGGKYATGIIAEELPSGATELKAEVKVSSYHMGHFMFRLCVHNNPQKPVSQECLDRTPLRIKEGDPSHDYFRYYPGKPWERREGDTYKITLELPRGITCTQCVLQWIYITGNSWGTSKDGVSCLGCGIQEEFRNCADISIGAGSNTIEATTARPVVNNAIAEKPNEAFKDVDLHRKDVGTSNAAYFPRQHTLVPPSSLKSAFETEWKILQRIREEKVREEKEKRGRHFQATKVFHSRQRQEHNRIGKKNIKKPQKATTPKAPKRGATKQTTSAPVLSWVRKVMTEADKKTKVTPKRLSPYPSHKEINLSKGQSAPRRIPDRHFLSRNKADLANTLYHHIPETSTKDKQTLMNSRKHEITTPMWTEIPSSIKNNNPFHHILIPEVHVKVQGESQQRVVPRVKLGAVKQNKKNERTNVDKHFSNSGFINNSKGDRKTMIVTTERSPVNDRVVSRNQKSRTESQHDLYHVLHGNLVHKQTLSKKQPQSYNLYSPTSTLENNDVLTAGRLTPSSSSGRLPSESIYVKSSSQPSDTGKVLKTVSGVAGRKAKRRHNVIRNSAKKSIIYSAAGKRKNLSQPRFVFDGKFSRLSSGSKNQNKHLEQFSNNEETAAAFDDDLPVNTRVQTWETTLPTEEKPLSPFIDSTTPSAIPQTTEPLIKSTLPVPAIIAKSKNESNFETKLDPRIRISFKSSTTPLDIPTLPTTTNQQWHSSSSGMEKTSRDLPTVPTTTDQEWRYSSNSGTEKIFERSDGFISQPNLNENLLSTPEFMISEFRQSLPMTTPESDIFVTNLSENKVPNDLQPEGKIVNLYIDSKQQRQEGSEMLVHAQRIKKVVPKPKGSKEGVRKNKISPVVRRGKHSENKTRTVSKGERKRSGFTRSEIRKFHKQYNRALKVLEILHNNPQLLLKLPMFAGHNISDAMIGKLVQRMENAKRHIQKILYENAKNAT